MALDKCCLTLNEVYPLFGMYRGAYEYGLSPQAQSAT